MEEEKAAAYYDELTRKGEGAARFKQGLGFSSASNDAIPSRGSALPSSSSSFLSKFVKASSPSKTSELEKQVQLESIQSKLKKKPEKSRTDSSSRVSKENDRLKVRTIRWSRSRSNDKERRHTRRSRSRDSGRHSRRSRSRDGGSRHSRRRSRSRSRDAGRSSRRRSRSWSRDSDRHSRRRSRSRSRDKYSSRRGRSHSRSSSQDDYAARKKRNRSRETERLNMEKKNESSQQKSGKITKVDYGELIKGYDNMTPAERVKAKMKLQLSETAEKDETKGVGSGWERFNFDKDAPLDDEEIEAAEDDTALVKKIGQSFRFSAVETRKEDEIKAAHDEAMFGAPSLSKIYVEREDGKLSPVGNYTSDQENNDATEEEDNKKEEEEASQNNNPLSNLISAQALSMQQGSWRDRVRKL